MSPSERELSSRGRGLLNIKDTIESIVVAFILAFAFRAFVAEAFVIPTGSMAPNLYGVHRMQTCTACGTEYAYGFSPMPGGGLHPPNQLVCPNCGLRGDKVITTNPDGGDRIFVLKWLFDVGRLLPDVDNNGPNEWWHVFKPRRWDAVVFKDPNDGTTNFIKRLIGLPGEVLEIIDGDIYTAKASDLAKTPEGRSVLDKLERRRALYEDLGDAEKSALDHCLKIRRKTKRAQRVLWLPAYNHDFLPVNKPSLATWRTSLDQNNGWQTGDRKLRFEPTKGDASQTITFVRGNGPRSGASPGPPNRPVVDVYAYNGSRGPYSRAGGDRDGIDVSDVRLKCLLVPRGDKGSLALSLTKRDDRFTALFADDGQIKLVRTVVSKPEAEPVVIGQAEMPAMEPGKPVRLALSNADYRVTVWVEDEPVIQTADEQYPALDRTDSDCIAGYARGLSLNNPNAIPEIAIAASGMKLELWHVGIDRDVYYRSPVDPGRSVGWGVQGQPIYLRNSPDRSIKEYYCLGDNSPLSKDSRLWNTIGPHLVRKMDNGDYQLGTVPADQMIGRAFLVYWPAGYPLLQDRLPLIPNYGDMRLIR